MQKLFALENHFLRGKMNPTLVSSLELLWYLLLGVRARNGLGFVEMWLGQVKTMFASQLHKKVLCDLLSLCLKNPLQILWWLALEQEGSWLHCVLQAYPNAMRHPIPCTRNTCTLNPGFVCTCANLSLKIPDF